MICLYCPKVCPLFSAFLIRCLCKHGYISCCSCQNWGSFINMIFASAVKICYRLCIVFGENIINDSLQEWHRMFQGEWTEVWWDGVLDDYKFIDQVSSVKTGQLLGNDWPEMKHRLILWMTFFFTYEFLLLNPFVEDRFNECFCIVVEDAMLEQ